MRECPSATPGSILTMFARTAFVNSDVAPAAFERRTDEIKMHNKPLATRRTVGFIPLGIKVAVVSTHRVGEKKFIVRARVVKVVATLLGGFRSSMLDKDWLMRPRAKPHSLAKLIDPGMGHIFIGRLPIIRVGEKLPGGC